MVDRSWFVQPEVGMAKKSDTSKKKKPALAAAATAQDAADAGQLPWIPCVSYELESVLNGNIARLDLTAYDGNGKEHGLNIRGKADRPELVVQLMGLLAKWPDLAWDFQSQTNPSGQVGTIVAVRKRP
jgi:hypothetical protein